MFLLSVSPVTIVHIDPVHICLLKNVYFCSGSRHYTESRTYRWYRRLGDDTQSDQSSKDNKLEWKRGGRGWRRHSSDRGPEALWGSARLRRASHNGQTEIGPVGALLCSETLWMAGHPQRALDKGHSALSSLWLDITL